MMLFRVTILVCVTWTINCCMYNGRRYKVGDTYSADGCQTCTCGQYGRVKCVSRESCGADFLKCKFGRYSKDLGQKPSCNPFAQVSCPTGFFCSGGPADEPGFCCKSTNPCRVGQPKNKNGDAIPCIHKPKICGKGYICVGSDTSSSACCKGCTLKSGRRLFLKDTFIKPGGIVCTCVRNGRIVCKKPKPPKGCDFFGQFFKPGESFPARDGCNTCRCSNNGLALCTKKGCIGVCSFRGMVFQSGDSFPAGDNCNTCTCTNGQVGCTEKACPPGQPCKPGESFFDGCNTCSCQSDGNLICTLRFCLPCKVKGKLIKTGDSFPAGDGCNTCKCDDGKILCTRISCRKG